MDAIKNSFKKMKYSLTHGGILVMVLGTLAVQYVGLSESCFSELVEKAPLLIGAVMAWIGRLKAGNVNLFGFKY